MAADTTILQSAARSVEIIIINVISIHSSTSLTQPTFASSRRGELLAVARGSATHFHGNRKLPVTT